MRAKTTPLAEIRQLLAEHRSHEVRDLLPELHPADIADVLTHLEEDLQPALYRLLDREQALDVFEQLEEEEQATLLESLSREQVAAAVANLPPDDQADLMTTLPEAVAERLLALLPPQARAEVRRLMAYPEDTAGALMTTEFATLPPDISVHDALARLREMAPSKETILYSYVVDRVGRLQGLASLEDLVLAGPDQTVREVMDDTVVSVQADEDSEQVAHTIQKYDLVAVPVVNSSGILVGMITVDDVLDLIEEEQTEDMYHFGAAGKPGHRYLYINPLDIARQRVKWLAILILGGFASSTVIRYSESVLKETVALAFFITMLCGSGGNAGTQAATVITRSLATGEVSTSDALRVLRKELTIGLSTGLMMGLLGLCLAVLIYHDLTIGAVVGVSMVIAICLATSIGGLLPLAFEKMNLDPALVSSPAIASLVDVTTLCIYFAIAHVFLTL